MPTQQVTFTVDEVRRLVDELHQQIRRARDAVVEATRLCETIAAAAESPDLPGRGWHLVAIEARGIPEQLPGPQYSSEATLEDTLADVELLRGLVQITQQPA